MSKWGLPIILGAVVVVMVGLFLLGDKQAKNQPEPQLIGTKHENQGQEHIADGATHAPYNSNLPTSGPHYITPADWGTYDKEIVDEILIHNLEHGGIVITYKPDLAKDKLERLKAAVNNLPKNAQFNNLKVVLAPRAKNDKLIQMAAWEYTYDLDDVDEAKIKEFYDAHINKGPELVP